MRISADSQLKGKDILREMLQTLVEEVNAYNHLHKMMYDDHQFLTLAVRQGTPIDNGKQKPRVVENSKKKPIQSSSWSSVDNGFGPGAFHHYILKELRNYKGFTPTTTIRSNLEAKLQVPADQLQSFYDRLFVTLYDLKNAGFLQHQKAYMKTEDGNPITGWRLLSKYKKPMVDELDILRERLKQARRVLKGEVR